MAFPVRITQLSAGNASVPARRKFSDGWKIMMLNHNEAYWQQKGAHLTVSAILNQPRLWQEGLEQVEQQQEAIAAFWQACPPGN